MVSLLSFASSISAQTQPSHIVVFEEQGFPAADSATPSTADLHALFAGAEFVGATALQTALASPQVELLVMPFGSAFPEAAWTSIADYLSRGGNLLVLGGKPFTRAAYHTQSGWQLRDYSVRFIQELRIDQYQPTQGSDGLKFVSNPDVVTKVPAFAWKQAFSPVIRLSGDSVYARGGSAGFLDARLDAFAWGMKDGIRLSAPAIQIDQIRGRFAGGRWVFLNSELTPDFYTSAEGKRVVGELSTAAAKGSLEFTVRPTMPLYLPGEPVQLQVNYTAARKSAVPLSVEIKVTTEQQSVPQVKQTVALTDHAVVTLPSPTTKGLHLIEASVLDGDHVVATYRSGFWMRDEQYLNSGPRLGVNQDFMTVDGKPLAVVGTTYMASDVQRLFFDHPNVYVWDRDLGEIAGAGLNMIRTGWWTGWDKLADENGRPYERTLRTLEAYLMTARKHGLPVQFNFFAFLPDVFGGANAYLDPDAVRRQQSLVSTVAGRFKNVPYVAWDLINEPSVSQHLWKHRPNGDNFELNQWNRWLSQRYPDRAALAHAWSDPGLGAVVPVPSLAEWEPRAMYVGPNSLRVYDFSIFAQQYFADWAKQMRNAIRGSGAQQLITVGQDEGGNSDRLTPAFFGDAVDFTTTHSWWQNDDLLWDSLVAKQPGKAMLVQETGLQRELTLDEVARRTVESEGALFERKVAMSFVQGSGAIQWLWHSNSYMTESNESPIGALRTDGTEKPEAAVMRGFAAFAKAASGRLSQPQQPEVAIVTSQAAQYSVASAFQIEAQRRAVHALCYGNRTPAYVVTENNLAKLGSPKLAILPSAQALSESAWQELFEYVKKGGNILITGPIARDEHWRTTNRTNAIGVEGAVEPLTYRSATIRAGSKWIAATFTQDTQNWLEAIRFGADGFVEKQVGKGRIFWASFPVELAEGEASAAELYEYVLAKIGAEHLFETASPLPTGVLVYPTVLEDAVLYVIASDDASDHDIDIKDKTTGTHVKLHLGSQHAAVVLLDKRDGAVIAKY
jgi:hypothetical protein